MKLAWSLLALAACKSGGDDFPINPGGDDTSFPNTMPDAALPDGATGDGAGLTGKVCVLTDMRNPMSCATTDAGGILVSLGGQTAMTEDDGSFTIATPSGANLVWTTQRVDLVPSIVPFTTSNNLPMVSVALYADVTAANGVIIATGQGSAVIYVTQADMPLAGVSGLNSGAGRNFTDTDNSAVTWRENGETQAHGALWFASVLVAGDSVAFTATPQQGTPQIVNLPVVEGAITFTTLAFP